MSVINSIERIAHIVCKRRLVRAINNNRSIRFVSKPPVNGLCPPARRRKREREREKGRGVVNKSLVIGLGPTTASFRLLLFTIQVFFLISWSKSQGCFCKTKLFLEKKDDQLDTTGRTDRFFFLLIIFYISTSLFEIAFRHLGILLFERQIYDFLWSLKLNW